MLTVTNPSLLTEITVVVIKETCLISVNTGHLCSIIRITETHKRTTGRNKKEMYDGTTAYFMRPLHLAQQSVESQKQLRVDLFSAVSP